MHGTVWECSAISRGLMSGFTGLSFLINLINCGILPLLLQEIQALCRPRFCAVANFSAVPSTEANPTMVSLILIFLEGKEKKRSPSRNALASFSPSPLPSHLQRNFLIVLSNTVTNLASREGKRASFFWPFFLSAPPSAPVLSPSA